MCYTEFTHKPFKGHVVQNTSEDNEFKVTSQNCTLVSRRTLRKTALKHSERLGEIQRIHLVFVFLLLYGQRRQWKSK